MDAPATLYDVIIIGSGVTGAITAWQLSLSGAKVLLLEAGEIGPPRLDLVGAYAAALDKSPGSPYMGRQGDRYAPDSDTNSDYYQQDNATQFRSTYLRRLGGSTWHFLGNAPRLIPNDFRMKTRYGVGVDWPLTYDELELDYCQAEKLLGVSGDHDEWNGFLGAKRTLPYPMSKIWESYSDRQVTPIINGLDVDGVQLKVMNTPQARNSTAYDGRPACQGNSSCVPICPVQAKYDATVHIKKATATGAELRAEAVVTRIALSDNQKTVSTVEYKDWDGGEHRVRGRMIVLAAHAIETAKLLLYSQIANSSDQVGRNLMDHPQGAGGGLSPQPLFPFRGPPTTSGIDIFRDGDFRRRRAAFRMSLGNDGLVRHQIELPQHKLETLIDDQHLFGAKLRAQMRQHLTRQFCISFSAESLPSPDNQVTLSGALDALGIPKPALTFKVSDYTAAAFDFARDVLNKIFDAMNADSVVFKPKQRDPTDTSPFDFTGAGHIMGTCRMGNDAADSVVDPDGRSHDHPNLFIVGSSVFPTCGTANPTLTAVALTLRANRAILRDLKKGTVSP
jgi:choline dehydrogenase-like flavoprotein